MRALVWAAAAGVCVLAGCDGSDMGDPVACEPATQSWATGPGTPPLDCATAPQLCGLQVTPRVHEPDAAKALDIVFLGDGFTAETLATYQAQVDWLEDGLLRDSKGIVGSRPHLFNLHRVDVLSKSFHVLDAERSNTALRGCMQAEEAQDASPWLLSVDDARAVFTAEQHVAEPDVVVVILNTHQGRANSHRGMAVGRSAKVVVLNLDDGPTTLTHELGHSLAFLLDEYSEWETCAPQPSSVGWSSAPREVEDAPNVTSDPRGTKWQHLVHGAVEGGARYGCGIYHPTHHCRMEDHDAEDFCPVCRAAINQQLDVKEFGSNDGRPRCSLTLFQEPQHATPHLSVLWQAVDFNALRRVTLMVDTTPLQVPVVAGSITAYGFPAVPAALSPGRHVVTLTCEDQLGSVETVAVGIHVDAP